MSHISPTTKTALKAAACVMTMLDDPENHVLGIVGDEFTPEQLFSVIEVLAKSRPEPFAFSHSNQDPHVFVLVFQTEPRKFVRFPFRNAAERKSIVKELIEGSLRQPEEKA